MPPTSPVSTARTGARIIAITSGKGGVGKTFVSANLAAALTWRGQRVLVLDADLGLADLDVVLNLHPKVTLGTMSSRARHPCKTPSSRVPGGFSVPAGARMVE